MNNSVFGKTLENIRNRVDIRLISSKKVAQKLAAKVWSLYDLWWKLHCRLHEEDKLYFNKPVYLGLSILDLRKSLMYDFHYNYIKTKYGDNAKLLFTDTVSHMKLRPTIFTKISTPTLRNGLTLVTIQLIIHLELKQDWIVKCSECLRMKLMGTRLLNLLVWDLNFTLTKSLMALKIKNVRGCQRMW